MAPLKTLLTALIAASAFVGPAAADRRHDPPDCEELAGRTIGDARVLSADVIAATETLPEYCRVRGLIEPKLNFELRLPRDWNRKLHYGGGGGYNGSIPPVNVGALQKGFAQVSSDSGHQGSGLDASFVQDDPLAAAQFGFLSVPTVTATAHDIVRKYYGRHARRTYFEGCSNGGREALMNVQRFPWLFDGVIARAPAYNWVGFMGAFNRTAKALAAPGGAMSPAKVATLGNAVLGACDALDGIADGVVSNPQACSFDPATLRCPGGGDAGDACLSDPQLAVVRSWTEPATFLGGRYRNAGWPLSGNEAVPGAWDLWVSGGARLQFQFQDTTVKYYLARDPNADSLLYDYESNPFGLFVMSLLNDATNAAIHPFVAAGGKLILWHGTNDSALSYRTTTEYHQRVVHAVGGPANAEQFLRYYLAPGVNHCAGGPGADATDLLAALDAWVSRRQAPGTLLAERRDPTTGATVLSRPLCEYPSYPRYGGQGDPNLASSYACASP
jgi:feruloyl esterase